MDDTIDLFIDSLAAGGWGVGRFKGKVIFVPLTVPGDRISCRIIEEKRQYAFGKLNAIEEPSPARVAPPCPAFGRCGGCQWQHVEYQLQLNAKRDILVDALGRIGGIKDPIVRPIAASPRPYGWRTTVDLAFGLGTAGLHVGFYGHRSHQVVPVSACPVARDEINGVLPRLAGAIADLGFGTRGAITLLAGMNGKVSAHLISRGRASIGRERAERFISATGLVGVEVTAGRGTKAFGDPVVSYPGWDGRCEMPVFCRPSGFAQANPDVNRELIDRLVSLDLAGRQVLELFCGSGNLSLPMARAGARVTGVEASSRSVDDAVHNAGSARLENVTFVAGDVVDVIRHMADGRERFDLVVLDPPRIGARAVMEQIAAVGATDVVYISCSPPTLARDLAVLTGTGWRLEWAEPLDMFPQTFHGEAICHLTRG